LTYGDLEFQYNANGDLTAQIQHGGKSGDSVTQYTYDVFGNLKAVVLPNGKKITYIVDGQHRRVGKKINGVLVQGFIYQNQTQIAAELDGKSNIVQQYIYGEKLNVPDYMIMNGQKFRIISDQVGTPKLIVDLNGNAVATLSFDEFGVPGAPSATPLIPFGFAGGIYDPDTGLVRFGARDYNPVVGRWTTNDPILFKRFTTNLYEYAVEDPINFMDSSGLYGSDEPFGGGLGGLLLGSGIVVGIGAVTVVAPEAVEVFCSENLALCASVSIWAFKLLTGSQTGLYDPLDTFPQAIQQVGERLVDQCLN